MLFRLLFLLCLLTARPAAADWTYATTVFEGEERTYKYYTPVNLAPGARIVVLIHGLSTTMDDYDGSNWTAIADTANIILLAPQGLPFHCAYGLVETSAFNSGLVWPSPSGDIPVNGAVNDVGFIAALLDTIATHFEVDTNRCYVTGFSNGGMMTQRLACALSNRLAAAVSVSGTRSVALPPCPAGTLLPVAHFHGDADPTVQWNGYVDAGLIEGNMTLSVDSQIRIWQQFNEAFLPLDTAQIGDTSAPVYLTRYRYATASGDALVALYHIHQGIHAYYSYNSSDGSFDIAHESWKFMSAHIRNATTALPTATATSNLYAVYPNPSGSQIFIKGNLADIDSVSVFSHFGQCMLSQPTIRGPINVSSWPAGAYLLRLTTKQGKLFTIRFIR